MPKHKEDYQNISKREKILGKNGTSEESPGLYERKQHTSWFEENFRIFKLEEADYNAIVTGCKPKQYG